MFQIVYSKKALKFLKKQDIPTRKRIVAAIDRLPAEGDIKKASRSEWISSSSRYF